MPFSSILSVRLCAILSFLCCTHGIELKVRMVINGHLAWVCQAASGNRGDDFRALKLCETQPYTWLHPNGHTGVYSILGLQGEEKAGKRGMKTVGSCSLFPFSQYI